ncbi:hypothetical protein [Aeromonas caviae]|uniref:hypothetical protein n=1 Tax=Aeromonas caviae TaxID=648 RepID=UPI002E7AC607|nr:hypothetical protein [Aeromonas caviae]MEE1911894.1 hypothetical protein [Aeromonas caviae]
MNILMFFCFQSAASVRDWGADLKRGASGATLPGARGSKAGSSVGPDAFLSRINPPKDAGWHPFFTPKARGGAVFWRFKERLNSLQKQKTGVTLGYKTTLPGIGTFFADTCKRFQRPTETILKEQECET